MSEIRHHGYPCPMTDDEITEALWKLGGYSPEGVAVQETIAALRAALAGAQGERDTAIALDAISTAHAKKMGAKALAAESEARRLREALESIAANTCCAGCQEAARVARAALSPAPAGEEK